MSKALFLDRDGVLNYDKGYTHIFNSTEIIPGSAELIRFANQKKYKVIIITNQSGIGRGLYSEKEFHVYMDEMLTFFNTNGATIEDYFFAPYYKFSKIEKYRTGKKFRKPECGMILSARDKYNLNLSKSILIGDKISDIDAGLKSGVSKLFLLSENHNKKSHDGKYCSIRKLTSLMDYDIW